MFTGLYADGFVQAKKYPTKKPNVATANRNSFLCIQMSAPVSKAGQGQRLPIPTDPWAASHVLQQSTGTVQAQLHQPGFAPSCMFGWCMHTPCSIPCPFPWLYGCGHRREAGRLQITAITLNGDQVGKAGTQ